MASINWPIFFDNRHDNNLRNQNSSALSQAWSQMTTPLEKKAFVSNDDNIVILAANSNNTIAVLHSFKNIGGTLLQPIKNFVCFVGANEHTAVVNMSMQSITASINFTTPPINDILA